jgi:hypothetical protein
VASPGEAYHHERVDEKPSPIHAKPDEIASQLEKTAADLRVLGEQVGAIPPGSSAKAVSQRQATIVFVGVVVVAGLVAWFIWDHWHSLLAATAPLVWIFAHGWRWRRRNQRSNNGAEP